MQKFEQFFIEYKFLKGLYFAAKSSVEENATIFVKFHMI